MKDDFRWDEHILQLCKNMNCYLHVLRRLSNYCLKYINHIFNPNWITDSTSGDALLKVIWIVCRESKMFVVELYKNGYRHYITTRGTDLVKSLKLQTIREHIRETIFCLFDVSLYTSPLKNRDGRRSSWTFNWTSLYKKFRRPRDATCELGH